MMNEEDIGADRNSSLAPTHALGISESRRHDPAVTHPEVGCQNEFWASVSR